MSGQKWRKRVRQSVRQTDEQTDRQTDRQTETVMSWVMACALQTQLANMWLHVWPCLSASAWIYTDSAFCLCNDQNKRKGVNIKERRIFPIPCYLKMTPIVLLFSLFLFAGVAGERARIISVRFGEQMRWGNSEGALFWLCLPMFDQEHTGPWLDSSSALLGDSAPAGAASDKTARAFWKSEHSPHGREECLQNSQHKALIHKFQALLIPALPV